MHRLLVFDLDGTLAPIGKGMKSDDIGLLKELEQSGYTIVICSGKPVYYLCGFVRQLDLEHPIMIGENGGTFQFGVNLPPEKYDQYPCSELAKTQLKYIRELIDEKCSDQVWYQPNEIAVTPFPRDHETFDIIQDLLDSHAESLSELKVYRHVDSFDLTPKCISKSNGMKYLSFITGFYQKDCIAIGDGVNDVPMFEYADLSIGIGNRLPYRTDITFDCIHDALEYMKNEMI